MGNTSYNSQLAGWISWSVRDVGNLKKADTILIEKSVFFSGLEFGGSLQTKLGLVP